MRAVSTAPPNTVPTLQVWNLMPLDPVAWLVMYGEHQAALGDLIAANMRHRLPLEAVRDAQPPPPQVRDSSRRASVV